MGFSKFLGLLSKDKPTEESVKSSTVNKPPERTPSPSMASTTIKDDVSPALTPTETPITSPSVTPRNAAEVLLPEQTNQVAWFKNLKRIRHSDYYNRSVEALHSIQMLSDAMDKKSDPAGKYSKGEMYANKLSPSEKSLLKEYDSGNWDFTSFFSPCHKGKSFEFRQKIIPGAAKKTDCFRVTFKQGEAVKCADFFVTNHCDVVVVETKEDFENTQLFRAANPEALHFGFKRIVWVDTHSKQIKDTSNHSSWSVENTETDRVKNVKR